MKKQSINLLILLFSITLFSQNNFESGYFINNNGTKTECLIKNMGWRNNPIEFEYKLNENAEVQLALISTVKEFGLSDIIKFQRFFVEIDQSTNLVREMSNNRLPDFIEKTVFLKLLIEGKANLYLYEEGSLRRYFYSFGEEKAEPLIFKEYLNENNKVAKNNEYKRQLGLYLNCGNISTDEVLSITYDKQSLIKYFIKYNQCENSTIIDYSKKEKSKSKFNLYIRSGLINSVLSLNNSPIDGNPDIDFGSASSFRIGVEAEIVLGFNNNKWAVFFEPSFQSYKTEKNGGLYKCGFAF